MTQEEKDRYYRQGVRRLRDWMPACRARALTGKGPDKVEFHSAVGKAQEPYMREKNLASLIIWPGEKGGWLADLVLKNIPSGISDVMGTPVQYPHATFAEAEDGGRRTLEMVLFIAHQNRGKPEPTLAENTVIFELYGWSFEIPGRMLATIVEMVPDYANPYGTQDKARRRVDDLLRVIAPGVEDFWKFDFDSLDREKMLALMSVLCGASLSGVGRHPPITAKAPDGKGPVRTAAEWGL